MSFTFCFKGPRSLLVGTFVVQSPDHSHRRSKGKYYGILVVKEDIGQHDISLANDDANTDQGGAKSAMNRRGKSKDSGRRGQGAGREDDDEGR